METTPHIKNSEEIINEIKLKLMHHFGKELGEATPAQMYKAAAMTVRDDIMRLYTANNAAVERNDAKQLYYLSVEFLMGRALTNNIINLGAYAAYGEAFEKLSISFDGLEDLEPEAGLGNGGLGRLAACFLDSLASLRLPAMGCGIRYEYGLFKQKIVDGAQQELPDNWLEDGNVWEIEKPEDSVEVHFGGTVEEVWQADGRLKNVHTGYHTVIAQPYDMPIIGGDGGTATLRLWSAKSPQNMDMACFNRGEYIKAVEEEQLAEVISKVLYPEDNHTEGKKLRLRQHYFFSSATVQYIVREYKRRHGKNLSRLPDKVVIQINDTHPALAIPEMMRILLDDEGLSWDAAWDIVARTFNYTNHTVMAEALESWPEDMFKELLPRVYAIILAINDHFTKRLWNFYPGQWERIGGMAIIGYGKIRMANLCLASCNRVNGVSQLHAEILKQDAFRDFYIVDPQKFLGITNGITQRRWLAKANLKLYALINQAVGGDVLANPGLLTNLRGFSTDPAFMERFRRIKDQNKQRFSRFLFEHQGTVLDPDWVFNVQAKRLHEYKRQLLNILHVLYLYQRIESGGGYGLPPQAFIFAAKASPGYTRAKRIIQLINSVSRLIASNPAAREKLKVVFVENYGVSVAEHLIPAAQISQQISTAGKEASGTGNMKFMLNGALTIGTMDGANVEMFDAVGKENIFIFGLTADEVGHAQKSGSYHASEVYEVNHALRRVLDTLINGKLTAGGELFTDIYHALVFPSDEGPADPFFVLADFDAYAKTSAAMMQAYADPNAWTKSAILNTAAAGVFSSDRTIRQYNEAIWQLTPTEA
ncbi:MAG: glycogen/starch/alpha-glucan phosphorylase [Bacillota bacterium]